MVFSDIFHRKNVTIKGNLDSKKAILFSNGFGTDLTVWDRLLPSFQDQYRIILFDNLGTGKLQMEALSPSRYDSIQAYVNDLLSICSSLCLKAAHAVGHSLGAMVLLVAAQEQPEAFDRLALLNASPRFLNDRDYRGGFDRKSLKSLYEAMENNYQAWASGFGQMAMEMPKHPDPVKEFVASLQRVPPDVALVVLRAFMEADIRPVLPSVPHPTLVLQTRQDAFVPLEASRFLAEHIPQAQFRLLDTDGHLPHVSDPHQVALALKEFFTS